MGLNIIYVTPEAAPFAKTGGLADVAGSLPVALKKLGCAVTLFMPFYRSTASGPFKFEATGVEVTVPVGKKKLKGDVLKSADSGVTAYFLRCDEYYDRTYLYGTPKGDYLDNIERFAFFSRGTLEAIKALKLTAELIHSNDWQSALIPAYLKDVYKKDPYFNNTATLFTVHNIAYQGLFPPELYELTGLSPALFNPEGLEFWGNINFLKAGIVYSEIISTVSTTYGREIQTPEYGWGLDGLLKRRAADLFGVLNGVDYAEWDPSADRLIPENYSSKDLRGKSVCKAQLLKRFGLKLREDTPLIGMITRLADQKGLDILSEAMPSLMKLDLGLIMLGSGDIKYRLLMEELAARYTKKLSVKIAFDNTMAHLVEAGSDMFLMPSRYEPCGLNQMYSLKYGTVPVVRATGGLEDTVREYAAPGGDGFKFKDYSPGAIVDAVKEALTVYRDKKAWEELQRNGMKEDFSWEKSARKYLELYKSSIGKLPKKTGKLRQPVKN